MKKINYNLSNSGSLIMPIYKNHKNKKGFESKFKAYLQIEEENILRDALEINKIDVENCIVEINEISVLNNKIMLKDTDVEYCVLVRYTIK